MTSSNFSDRRPYPVWKLDIFTNLVRMCEQICIIKIFLTSAMLFTENSFIIFATLTGEHLGIPARVYACPTMLTSDRHATASSSLLIERTYITNGGDEQTCYCYRKRLKKTHFPNQVFSKAGVNTM